MDLELNVGSIWSCGRRITGLVSRSKALKEAGEDVRQVIEDEEVDDFIQTKLDLSEFSEDPALRDRLRNLLWDRRAIFKGMGCIRDIEHRINLKEDGKPVCHPVRRRSPKEEEVERASWRSSSRWA